jgi:hypothetical protein
LEELIVDEMELLAAASKMLRSGSSRSRDRLLIQLAKPFITTSADEIFFENVYLPIKEERKSVSRRVLQAKENCQILRRSYVSQDKP